jgi:hypothetical protein
MKYIIGILILIPIALHFFYYSPEIEKSFKEGKEQCEKDTDSIYIKGDTVIQYVDRFITLTKREVITIGDTTTTDFDTTFVSGKDTISIGAVVSIVDNVAEWFMDIEHKDAETMRIDTVKTYYPKYIETVVEKTDWFKITIAYVAGVASAVILFFVAQ